MKKILSILLAVLMLVGALAMIASCGDSSTSSNAGSTNTSTSGDTGNTNNPTVNADKVKVFTEIELTAESYAFAVAKENAAMKTAANELLASLKESGELDKIINSFFDGTATFTYKNPVSSVPTGSDRNNYLVVGTNAYFPPFEYYEGDKFTGIDIQIASLLAEKLNKTLYVLDMDFEALIPATKNGECDISMAGLTVSEERKQTVDFTDEYYESAQVLIVKGDNTLFDGCKTAEDVEAVLKAQSSSFKVGAQNGTTGYMYAAGDDGFGYDGFANLTTNGYTTGALAVQDLANGTIDAVIIDKQPAIMIAASVNGK